MIKNIYYEMSGKVNSFFKKIDSTLKPSPNNNIIANQSIKIIQNIYKKIRSRVWSTKHTIYEEIENIEIFISNQEVTDKEKEQLLEEAQILYMIYFLKDYIKSKNNQKEDFQIIKDLLLAKKNMGSNFFTLENLNNILNSDF